MRILLRDLTPGTAYSLQLRSLDDNGNVSEWSRVFDLTTTSDTLAPKTPTGVSNTVSGTAFKFTWNAVTQSSDNSAAHDLRGYRVRVSSPNDTDTRVYETTDTKMDFSFENNVAVFGTPQAAVSVEVAAVDNTGNVSAYSAAVLATNPAPSAVTGVTVAAQTDGINVKWNPNTSDLDLRGYEVHVSTNGAAGTYNRVYAGAGTSYVHPTTLYSTDHFFKVYSADVFGTLSTATSTSAVRPASPFAVDATAPATPTGLAATLTNATDGRTAKAVVTWNAVTDTDGDLSEYIIDYKPSSETNWNTAKVDYEKTALTLVGLLPYTDYDFRIRASDFSANLSGWSTTVTKTATANSAPATVTGVAVTPGRDTVTISWTANSEADVANGAGTYLIDLSTSATFASNVTTYRTGATSITVTGLSTNTQYYARVKAVDSLGLASTNWSTTANGTTSSFPGAANSDGAVPTGAPTLSASEGIGYIYLNWTPVANADPVIYDVYMSTTDGFTTYDNTTKITEVSGTSAMIDTTVAGASLEYNTPYYFRVRARDRDGSSTSISSQASAMSKRVTYNDSAMGDAKNLVPGGAGELGLGGTWLGMTGVSFDNVDKPAEVAGVIKTDAGTGSKAPGLISEYGFDVTQGEQLVVEVWLKADLPDSRIYVDFRDQSNAAVGSYSPMPGMNTPSYAGSYAVANHIVPTAWTKYGVILTVTGTSTRARLGTIFFNHANGTERNARQSIAVRVRRRNTGDMVVEGTLSASAFAANTALISSLFIGSGGAVQSTNFNASSGFQLAETGLIIRGSGNVVDVAAVSAGTISAKTWNVGAGGIINIDSTGQVKSNNYALNSTGYKLSNTGLEVNDGSIDAKVLKTNSAVINDLIIGRSSDSSGTVRSFDYNAGTAGWKIGKGLFEINDGLISASALRLQNSPNLMPPQFADFEYENFYYVSSFWNPLGQGAMSVGGGAADGVAVTAANRFKGKRALSLDTIGGTGAFTAWFGTSSTDYNVSLEPGKTYIWSAYVKNRQSSAQTWTFSVKGDNGSTIGTQAFSLGASETSMVRRTFVFTVPAGVNSGIVSATTAGGFAAAIYLDGMQIEEKTGADNTPSPWRPPGATTMDGSGITTGLIRSNTNVTVSGSSLPAWSINTAGNAQFGDALVRGKLLVGTGADVYINKAPNSGNFETTGSGYTLYHTGASSPAIARTTTNPISGVGSLIATSAAGSKTQLGTSFSIASQLAGTAVRVGANVRVNATNAGSTIRINFMSGSTVISDILAYSEPRAGETNAVLAEYVVEPGVTIDGIRIFHDGTLTTTQFMIDDIVVNVDSEIGPSYMASSNYVRNTSGWRLDSLGNLEANQGDFRGTLRVGVKGERGALDGDILATGTVSGNKFSGTVVVSSLMTSSEDKTQQRWEASAEGIKLYGSGADAPAMISLPTDPNSTASFRGDVETDSLIVNDNMAIRGTVNEISKSSKLILSTGTTKPSSPPTAYNTWEQYNTRRYTAGGSFEGFDKGRWGLAKPTSQTNFYYSQVLYGANSKIQAINSTGTQVAGIDWQTGVRNGNTFAIGDTICAFGWRTDKTAWVEKYNLSGVKTSEVQLAGVLVSDWVNYTATYDGTNILMFSSNHGYSGKSTVYKYNATTGAYVGSVQLGSTTWNGVAIAAGNFDFGTPVIIVGYEESSVFRVHNATTGAELSQHNFPVVGNNKRIGGITWDGTRLWSHNNDLMLLARHSTLTWDATKSSTLYYGMTWFAGGSGHETQISARRTITMYKRARLRFDIPRVPDDPSGTDLITAAKIYLARSTSAGSNVEPANSVFQIQGTIANPSTAGTFDVSIPTTPVAGDVPPTVNTFTASAPAQILSTESGTPNILLKGDGTGNLGSMDLNTVGKVKFGGTGTAISQIKYGRAALQTDANGAVTITHGLGVAPAMIMARVDGTAAYDVGVTNVTTTTFVATIYSSSAPATKYVGNALPISWIAIAG